MIIRLLTIFMFLSVSGCSYLPIAFKQEEIQEQAKLDRANVTQNQTAVSGPITLYESIARALKYNLDYHVEFASKILAETQLDLSQYDLLPQLVVDSGYSGRDNFSGSSSQSLLTGSQSLATSTSSNRDIFTTDLKLSWNVLDFGLSYIRAKQTGDKILIAEEEKRKVVNRIVQDVRAAYWRAVTNDRLIQKVEALLERVSKAIEESKQVEIKRLDRPLTALTYQRELIGIKRELQELQKDLALAKIQLAALMNLRPGENYELAIPDRTESIKKIDISPDMMEHLALENRPELRAVSYEQRINANEAKAAILNLMPGLDLNFGKSHSSNSFLFNTNWLTYGAQISWNMLNVFKLPSIKKNIKARDKLLRARRLALSMAVMTQVHVSLAQYEFSKRSYKTASDFYKTQEKILKQIQSGIEANTVTEQSLIREEMNMMVAEVKYDIAYSNVENAYGSIFAALGIDPFPIDANSEDLELLSNSIRDYFEGLSLYDQFFSMRIE
jgi:outer membrane protein TolC